MNKIIFPIGYYPDPTKGKPISSGSIYIGEPDTDPEVVGNQKTVQALQENGSYVSISQPILTSAGGVPLYNGSPVSLHVLGDYSLKLLNSQGSQIYYVPSNAPVDAGETFYFDNVADMIAAELTVGNIYITKGYYSPGDEGGATYLIKTAAAYGGTPDEYGDHTVNTDDVAVLQYNNLINIRWFGAIGDGSTDDTAAIQACITYIDTATDGGTMYVPATSSYYKVVSSLSIPTSPNSFKIKGHGIWNSEVKLVSASADTLIENLNQAKLFVEDISLTATPDAGDVFRTGDICIDTDGVLNLTRVSMYGFETGVNWQGGFYHKFDSCDFRLMSVCLDNFTSNNVIVTRCQVRDINRFINATSGDGSLQILNSSFEKFAERVISCSPGTSVVFNNNYVENYSSTAVAAGLNGTYYDSGFVIINAGDTSFRDNFISCKGIRRIIDTAGTGSTIKSSGNKFLYQATTSNTEYFYRFGTSDVAVTNDKAYTASFGETGSYTTSAFDPFTLNYPSSSKLINPISLLDVTPGETWANATLLNSWVNQDTTNYQPLSYRKEGKRVYLRGLISGASATASTICTLPSGFRPTTKVYRVLCTNTQAATPVAMTFRIANTGSLIVSNTTYNFGNISLDDCSFELD